MVKRGQGPSRTFAWVPFPSKINHMKQPQRRERMGSTDCTNGCRAMRTELFDGMPLTERGFPSLLRNFIGQNAGQRQRPRCRPR